MKEFLRNFRKQKTVGILNIFSLSLGIMVSVIVGLWAINELTFDSFHKDKDRIYRIVQHLDFNNSRTKTGGVFKPLGEEAQAELPQIEEICRILEYSGDMRIHGKLYAETEVAVTDSNFFTFFTFHLKEGNPKTVLDAPNKIVLSENAVKRYFPDQDPIGQAVEYSGNTFTVSGIMENMPENSSLQADIILPFYGWLKNSGWGNNDGHVTFLKLRNGADLPAMREGIKQIVFRNFEVFKSVNLEVELEPLTEIHFSSGFLFDPMIKGNRSLVMIFVIVAIAILVISCINFTNLFVATSFIRARTVGIKKSQGGNKASLIKDFYSETICYTLIAIVAGIFLAYLAMPVFNNFTQSILSLDFTSPVFYIFLILLFTFTVLAAGSFPAFYLTRFNPIETMSGKFKGKKISVFQKVLLIIQFTASITLLIVIVFMQQQVDYMISRDLGFDKENVIHVKGWGNFGKSFKVFREEMLRHPSITDVTRKNSLPYDWQQGWPVKRNSGDVGDVVMEVNYVQENYFDFMDIKIIQGENPFYLESKDSITSVILNERAVEVLELGDQPIGAELSAWGEYRFVVQGVIKNPLVRSFHQEVHPQLYWKIDDNHWDRVLFFKVTGDPQQAIEIIRKEWEKENPEFPFEYGFLDETYEKLYTAEMNAGRVLTFAMWISFVISIAGLFAMTFYITRRRIREIGLRKVNGATVKDLLILLNRDFITWTLISFVIACPVAYFSMQSWLTNFTVRTSLSAWIFILVGMIAIMVTLLTTGWQTWKIANTNPVETLKSE